jgi:hypothetical protein
MSVEDRSVVTWSSTWNRTLRLYRSGCWRMRNQNSFKDCYIVEGPAVDPVGIMMGPGVPPREVFIKTDPTVAAVEVSSQGPNGTPSHRSCSELGWPPRPSRGRSHPVGKRYNKVVQGDQKVAVRLMITIKITPLSQHASFLPQYLAQSDCLSADRQGQGDTRLTLTPSVITNYNYMIMVSD